MDLCHLKHADLFKSCEQYKGGVVLRGDIAKDDEVYQADFLRNRVRLGRKWPRPSFLIDRAGCLDWKTMLCLLALRYVRHASLSELTRT